MATKTTDINEWTIIKFIASIRPQDPEVRKQLDFGYSYDGKVVILFEIRSAWDASKEIVQKEFAKIRFYKSKKEWHLNWMRANGKWELYEPFSKATHLEALLDIVKQDQYGCFLG
ncbi:DUF3024 domain-containing protein [Tamlana agarivorans]|uniref:DUF3024 domain-containing protein n=1 Tax=Pseudotamlana agarivorans TaxID=481183 RepID=A0ACC5U6H2_9FLAO|nr:DUF3024 domain-containing protein [Tamlana agarivorans]MBU2949914.1 DUF3024 domain-containing protein [Tamlana agarivorans]